MADKITGGGDFRENKFGAGMGALVRSLQAAFVVMAVIIVGMIIWFFTFGGYFIVKPQEAVIVLRFGEFAGVYTDDWHWVFPAPVNTWIRVPTSKQKLTSPRFMPEKKLSAFGDTPEGAQPPAALVPGKDGYLLTADANIIHTEWEVIYEIVNPRKYYFSCLCPEVPAEEDEVFKNSSTGEIYGVRGPRTLLKTVLENTVIKVTATEKVENALYKNFFQYMKAVESQFTKTIADMDIGISVQSVILKSKSPPAKAVRAFQEVIEAEQESSSEQNKARAYETEQKNSAGSESAKILAEAGTYKKRVVSELKAENIYFEKILKECGGSPGAIMLPLFTDAVTEAFAKVGPRFIINASENKRQQLRLKLNPDPLNQQGGDDKNSAGEKQQ
jgi:regulator of protease activity HflC (stomatin/prohibitin superfamily)